MDASQKLEQAKRRLDRVLNTLEKRVAVHVESLRETDASQTAALSNKLEQQEQIQRALSEQLVELSDYLEKIEIDLTPKASSSQKEPS